MSSILLFAICSIKMHEYSGSINHCFSVSKQVSDTTFILKIENEKRIVDAALRAKLTHELKAVVAKYKLKKPYKIAMGFTKGARDVETFLFGEQIFYTLAESGFAITGIPLDMPDEKPNAIPQIRVMNNIIYIILSKM
ncbi:hypothetical protein [Emticicia sp. BO119]|uniref:hypothetical protein n=1 Tax=Emticicia sp. BO119 TaxID=2757768 RepID=UPI001C699A3D|nr:hypothetical protein [Emticicia sp. BO119]